MNSDIVSTLRRGCFSEAKQLLERLSSPGPEESVVSLEISYYLGNLQNTIARGLTLQRANRDKRLEARVLRVLASAAWDRGDLEHAVTLSQDAHQASLGPEIPFWCPALQLTCWNVPLTNVHSARRFRCLRWLAARHIDRETLTPLPSFIWFTRGWKAEPACSGQHGGT
jgi:hypothetical protein